MCSLREGVGAGRGPLQVRSFEDSHLALASASGWSRTLTSQSIRPEVVSVEETGSVALGSVIFLPRPVVVSAIDAQPGSELSDGSPVLQVHEEGQRIEATASLEQRSMIELGDTAEVRLPDRTMVRATVEAIGPASAGGHEITLRPEPDRLTSLSVDGATVTVLVSEEVASDVLAAPAAALVRTDTAGYAVQVVAGGGVTLAPVETGVTADRLVEVSGDGIERGILVVAPGRGWRRPESGAVASTNGA